MHRRTFIQALAAAVAAKGLRNASLQAKETTFRPFPGFAPSGGVT
jgi:hypothetical protein